MMAIVEVSVIPYGWHMLAADIQRNEFPFCHCHCTSGSQYYEMMRRNDGNVCFIVPDPLASPVMSIVSVFHQASVIQVNTSIVYSVPRAAFCDVRRKIGTAP